MTYYDIEELWDYGFIQVSNDLGVTWTSLSNDNTTMDIDPDGYPSIKENLPGLTGSSGDWVTMEFDLSAYKGQTVLLSFRYMTDWATENPGWWVDNITINNQLIDDADEKVIFTVPPLPETDFIVSIIEVTVVNEEPVDYEISELILDSVEETGSLELNSHITEEGYLLIIVSPKLGPADYTIELARF